MNKLISMRFGEIQARIVTDTYGAEENRKYNVGVCRRHFFLTRSSLFVISTWQMLCLATKPIKRRYFFKLPCIIIGDFFGDLIRFS